MRLRLGALLTMVTVVAACERPAEGAAQRELAAQALKGVLAYPHSTVVSVTAGEEAAQAVFTTPAPAEAVATWYRQELRLNGWELQADGVLRDGSISIYADSAKRSLWITLKPNVGGAGTTYTLVGTIPGLDSTAAQRSGSSMSSKRIQRR
ncbi:MAG TPA: hypothetical protein VF882_00565 [Gemmatimonadales bacterium]